MARRSALARKLSAVETLGSVTVICSDKTGTLTENRMLVEGVWTPAAEYRVAGIGYEPDGAITGDTDPSVDPHMRRLARVAVACNDATLTAPSRLDDPWAITGDPTEGALLAFAGKLGMSRKQFEASHPRLTEIAFDADRRRMTTLHGEGEGVWVAVKGALETLAPLADPAEQAVWAAAREVAERYAAQGYRVLALADRTVPAIPSAVDAVEDRLSLAGLVAMADPPRPEVAGAVAAARAAGITPIMITGDHALTAQAVARRVGILDEGAKVLTGAELERMDDATFDRIVDGVAVYARTNPEQKLRIVRAWQSRGAVVAMTGDGVNDAPALKLADIGVAMGITGTEVSKEAADMVLSDDNLATIVAAVEEGRRIYDNIRRFVRYLVTTNSSEIWVMLLAPFAGLPIPLLPIQILWINLVSDGPPALSLGVEPVEADTMRRPPRSPSESIFGRGLWQHALWVGLLMAGVTLGIQALAIALGWSWRTMVFSTLAFLQLGHAMAVRSERESLFRLGIGTNRALAMAVALIVVMQLALIYVPLLQPIFETEALSAAELAVVLAASPLAFVSVEIEKWIGRRRARAG